MTNPQIFKQYLDLWRDNESALVRSPQLAALNRDAAGRFEAAVDAYLPDKEDLAEARQEAVFAPDYGVNIAGVAMQADVMSSFRCGVPQLNSILVVVANDTVYVPQGTIPEGLEIYAMRSMPADLEVKALGNDPAALTNALLLADGIYIRVAANAQVDKPIQIVNIFNSTMPMLTPRRVNIDAEAGASVKVLLCDHSQTPDTPHLNSQVVAVRAAHDASVELYDIEESSAHTARYWQLFAVQGSRSHLTVGSSCLRNGISHNDYFVTVEGNGAETNLSGLAICSDDHIIDNRVVLTHKGRHCTSRQLFKNALFDKARGAFGGKIIVNEGAENTDAVQTNRNLLASPEARMLACPQLEIYCDEVKCGHGATTGQLDEQALFYMQSRGIPRDEARMMLTQAFMADVVENISFEVLRQRLHVLVERRLAGTDGGCDTCATACHKTEL